MDTKSTNRNPDKMSAQSRSLPFREQVTRLLRLDNPVRLGVLVALLVVLQAVPSILTAATREEDWDEIRTASQPPGAIFMVVWIALYTCFALAIYFALYESSSSLSRTVLIALLVLQLALNWAWIPTFGQGHRKEATWILGAMLVLGAPILFLASRMSSQNMLHPATAPLLAPYFAWLVCALVLSSERNVMDLEE